MGLRKVGTIHESVWHGAEKISWQWRKQKRDQTRSTVERKTHNAWRHWPVQIARQWRDGSPILQKDNASHVWTAGGARPTKPYLAPYLGPIQPILKPLSKLL